MNPEEACERIKNFIQAHLPSEFVYLTIVTSEGEPGKASYNCDDELACIVMMETVQRLRGGH